MKTIYSALFFSILQYGISVWGGTSNKHFNRLVTLQKKAIRHVARAKYNSHTEPIFKKLGLLNLDDSYTLQCNKILYKKKSRHTAPLPYSIIKIKERKTADYN